MTRITIKDLEEKLEEVKRITGLQLDIDTSSGRYRVHRFEWKEAETGYIYKTHGCDLSPRLSKRELYEWLDAFQLGFTMGWDNYNKKFRRQEQPKLIGWLPEDG